MHGQVLLVLRWLRHRADLHSLVRDTGVCDANAYRYLHEGLDVIAAHAPDLHDVLAAERAAGAVYLCLDGTLIPTDRVAARVKVDGELRTTSGTRAGTTPSAGTSRPIRPAGRCGPPTCVPAPPTGLTAAPELVLPALYPHAARGLPVLADKGYIGAGIDVHTPVRRPAGGAVLHRDTRCYHQLITDLRAPAERAHALLDYRRALERVTVCPQRIGTIVAAALVLTSMRRGRR